MGYIKEYTNLSQVEKTYVYEHLRNEEKNITSLEDVKAIYNSKIYDYGKGMLFYFLDGKVVAKIYVVLAVAKNLKKAYIHKLYIDKEIKNKEFILGKLLNEGIRISKKYGVTDIRFGFSEEMIGEVESFGMSVEYKFIEMILKEKDKIYDTLKLEKLSNENIDEYVQIHNDSFSDMPHGSVIDINEAKEKLMNWNKEKEYYFIVVERDAKIGLMEISIEENKGKFDIGLSEEYRGKGYGKRILETAIQFLKDKNIDDICLTVIEENRVAYNMYKKRGFEESDIIGYWTYL